MNIHVISCTEDNFTEVEINKVKGFIEKQLDYWTDEIEQEKDGWIVVSLQSNKTVYRLVGFSPIMSIEINKILKYR